MVAVISTHEMTANPCLLDARKYNFQRAYAEKDKESSSWKKDNPYPN